MGWGRGRKNRDLALRVRTAPGKDVPYRFAVKRNKTLKVRTHALLTAGFVLALTIGIIDAGLGGTQQPTEFADLSA